MSCANRRNIAIILDAIILLFFILSMIYSSKIKSDTSSGNPFKREEESDKMNYFKYNISVYYLDKVHCICGEDTFSDFCSEEQLKSGCNDFYKNKDFKSFLKLDQCEEIQDIILNKN